MEKIKVFLLGILLYISKYFFFKVGSNWFEELQDKDSFEERVNIIRNRFWNAVLVNIIVVCGTIFILTQLGRLNFDIKVFVRMIAIIIALSASLGRGGWGIQSIDGSTIVERIDRGMFQISQLGATILLLIILTL